MSAPVLTREQVASFRRVAEAAGTFRPPPGDAGHAMGAALYDLERMGLIMHAGRGWKLTPHGDARWRDVLAVEGRRTG